MIRTYTLKDRIVGSTRRNGKLEIVDLAPVTFTGYVREPNAAQNWPGVCSVEASSPGWWRVTWCDYDLRKISVEKHYASIYEGDVSCAKRYLVENDIRLETPKCVFMDIETDSRVPVREQAEFATGRILCITAVGCDGHEFVWTLSDDTDDAERVGLAAYWDFVSQYDQVSAWNGAGFDFPVIEIRSKWLCRKVNAYWEGRRRLLFVDQLKCFERHHKAPESGDDKTSLKLGSVCESILGEGKNDFPANKTWEYWFAGGEKRAEMERYCLQDTRLLPKLEEATGYLALQQTLAEVSYTPADTHGLKPMPQTDGIMMRLAFLRGTHLPSKKPPPEQAEQYEGAFVLKPTKTGLHEMVHVCDFKSLYPTVIRSLNLGWETKGDLGCEAFGTGVMFGNEEESMLAAGCRELMDKREFWKKKAKADPNDKYAERMNKAYKIACNSIYGVMGSPWSRYYDVQLAESITLGAKALALETREEANRWNLDTIYMDTDSLFILGCTVDRFKEFVAHCNAVVYPGMLSARGANLAFNVIELDYEKCFKRLVFPLGKDGSPAAKRYAGSYEHYAFKPKAKPEIRGLEYMRGDAIRMARHKQKEAIDLILNGADGEQMEEWVLALRNRVMTDFIALEEIVLSKGLGKDLDDYKAAAGHVRLAKQLRDEGEDIGQGTRIPYVIIDGHASPLKLLHADRYDGKFDRSFVWSRMVYPCLSRVLAGAFPRRNWKRWTGRPQKAAHPNQTALF